MTSFKQMTLAGAAVLALAGCSSFVDTDPVANMPSSGNAFQQGLHKEYVTLALMEKAEDDGDDATYFITKAKSAALGEDVGPQPIAERMIPDGTKAEITMARKNLIDKLWKGGADETPGAAAKAQAMFDCWLQEQEENNQPKDIADCKAGFDKAYAMIKTTPPVAKAMPKKKMYEPKVPMPAPYIVYFDSDSAELDAAAMATLQQVAEGYKKRHPSQLLVAGHTDTRGDKKYNMGLSRYRSNEVGNALMTLGVPRNAVSKSRHGENAVAVDTGDNMSDRKNRRVSITFVR